MLLQTIQQGIGYDSFNNLNSMISSELQINQMASNLSQISNTVADPQLKSNGCLIDSIVG